MRKNHLQSQNPQLNWFGPYLGNSSVRGSFGGHGSRTVVVKETESGNRNIFTVNALSLLQLRLHAMPHAIPFPIPFLRLGSSHAILHAIPHAIPFLRLGSFGRLEGPLCDFAVHS